MQCLQPFFDRHAETLFFVNDHQAQIAEVHIGVLASRMQEAELETVSLWAGLPHYIAATPNSRGVLALAHKLTQVLDFRIDEGPLQRDAADFEGRIAEIVASDPALSEYVKDLKRREFAQ